MGDRRAQPASSSSLKADAQDQELQGGGPDTGAELHGQLMTQAYLLAKNMICVGILRGSLERAGKR